MTFSNWGNPPFPGDSRARTAPGTSLLLPPTPPPTQPTRVREASQQRTARCAKGRPGLELGRYRKSRPSGGPASQLHDQGGGERQGCAAGTETASQNLP